MENLILPNSMNTGRTTALKSKKARNGLPDDLKDYEINGKWVISL